MKNYVLRFLVSEVTFENIDDNNNDERQFSESRDDLISSSDGRPINISNGSAKNKNAKTTTDLVDGKGSESRLDYSYLMFEYPGGTFDSLFKSHINFKLKAKYDYLSLHNANKYDSNTRNRADFHEKSGTGRKGALFGHYGGGI